MAAVGRSVAVVAATAVPATDAPNGSFSSAPLALSSSAVAAPAQLAPLRSDPGTKLVPAGSGSAMAIPVAVPLPLLVTRMQYRSEEHTSELQSLMRISYAVLCLKKNKTI